jgi:hypothetical protein
MSTTAEIIIALIAGGFIGAAVLYLLQQGRTRRLRERFGPEYNRAVSEAGSRWEAEAKLDKLERKVKRLRIRPLNPTNRVHFQDAWRDIQGRFLDDPRQSLAEADRLIAEVMSAEGYPVVNFEQRAEDISVDHPIVVENYRAGHQIVLRQAEGRASTEDLRRAMIHYRALFDDLVDQPQWARTGA